MVRTASESITDARGRKLGEQTGLDTLVVLALNDEYLVIGSTYSLSPKLTH